MIRAGSLCTLKRTTGFSRESAQGKVGHYDFFLDDGELMLVLNAPFQDYNSSTWTFLCRAGIVYRIGGPFFAENWLKLL